MLEYEFINCRYVITINHNIMKKMKSIQDPHSQMYYMPMPRRIVNIPHMDLFIIDPKHTRSNLQGKSLVKLSYITPYVD